MSAHPKATLLDGIPAKDVETIFQSAISRRLQKKEVIVKDGLPSTHLFMVRNGRIRNFTTSKRGDEIVFCWLGPGDAFGLGSLLSHPPSYIGTAQALTEAEVLCWTHAKAREFAAAYPQIGENALRAALEHLHLYADRHSRIVSQRAEERLANVLLTLGHEHGRVHNGGVDLWVTNEELSSLADTSLFTTSRIMRRWSTRGLISKQRGSVFIRTPEALINDGPGL